MMLVHQLLSLSLLISFVAAEQTWPLPYQRYKQRPPQDPRCSTAPLRSFCPNGLSPKVIDFNPNDVIDILVMTNTVSNFDKTVLDSYKQTKVGIGLHSRMSSKNYTLVYSPFSSVLDASVPLIFPKKDLYWCNQAAVCITPDIKKDVWSAVQKVGVIGGDRIDSFIVWLFNLNITAPFYQTFTIEGSSKFSAESYWMLPFDGTNFAVSSLRLLNKTGASFFKNTTLHMSSFALSCDTPQLLGTPADLAKKQPKVYEDVKSFFTHMQPTSSFVKRLIHKIEFYWDVHVDKKFYYLFNEQLWKLKMKSPHIRVDQIQLVI